MPNVTSRTSKIVNLKTVPSRKSEKSARPSEPSRAHEDWLIARLKNPKEAAAYIEAAIEENDQGVLMLALRQVAMARGGVAAIAENAGVAREAAYRMLSGKGNPELKSFTALLAAAGLRLSVKPISRAKAMARKLG